MLWLCVKVYGKKMIVYIRQIKIYHSMYNKKILNEKNYKIFSGFMSTGCPSKVFIDEHPKLVKSGFQYFSCVI